VGHWEHQDEKDEIERLRNIVACVHEKQPEKSLGVIVRRIAGRILKTSKKAAAQAAGKVRDKKDAA
jgi:hypothetical protein